MIAPPIGQYHSLHPQYVKHYERWRKCRAAYLGGDAWYTNGQTYALNISGMQVKAATPGKTGYSFNGQEYMYLWRHPREKDWRYEIRKRASVYENRFRPLVGMQAASIAKACKKLVLPEAIQYLQDNVNRWGMDADMFRLQRICWAHVYGHTFVLLDKPEASTEPPSRLHELAAGIRTYAQVVSPLEVIDWQWDAECMSFDWALIVEQRPAQRTPPDMPKADTEQHVWTKLLRPGEWVRFMDGKEVDRGVTGYDFVPLSVQFGVGQEPECGEPIGVDICGDVVDKAIEAFNFESWHTDQLANSCFNQMWVDTSQMGNQDELELAVGTSTYVPTSAMGWASPDVAPMEHMDQSKEGCAGTMRQMLGQETKGEESQAAKSGVALSIESQSVSTLFSGYATAAETGERMVWQMAAVLEGADPEEVECEYADDFSALDAAARYGKLLQSVKEAGFTGQALAELQKQLWLATYPDAAPEVVKAVMAEIDAEVIAAKARQEAMRAAAVALAAGAPTDGEIPADETAEDDGYQDAPENGATEAPRFGRSGMTDVEA